MSCHRLRLRGSAGDPESLVAAVGAVNANAEPGDAVIGL
jgi:hypothetical protein